MSQLVVRTERLGKRYLIGERQRYRSLRDTIAQAWNRRGPATRPRRSFWALKDLDLEVRQGETFGIIGRNGAGKTTLLKILAEITAPTEGRVWLRGRVGSLLEVGTGFHPELTGRENIFLNGAILGMPRATVRRQFDEIVAFAEVEEFLDMPVKHYSSGMSVRLGFAVAAHLEPEILLVDEVLAVGDVQFQRKCLDKMQNVAGHGTTVIFVSHNLSAIRHFCDRVILVDSGHVAGDGPPEDVIAAYLGDEAGQRVREWPDASAAPQNGIASLRRVALRDAEGGVIGEIHTNTPLRLEIDFDVRTAGGSVGITAMLVSQEDVLVLSSINNLEPVWYGQPMPAGRFRAICALPANLLNNGRYRFDINLFARGFSDVCHIPGAVTFDVLDSPALRGDYFGEFGGVIRPRLDWVTQRLDGEDPRA